MEFKIQKNKKSASKNKTFQKGNDPDAVTYQFLRDFARTLNIEVGPAQYQPLYGTEQVKELPVLVQDQVVGVPVELLEAQGRGVVLVDLVDGLSRTRT